MSALPIVPTESTTPTAVRGSPRFRGTPTPTGNRARSKKPTPPDSFHSDPYQTDFEKDPSEIQVGVCVCVSVCAARADIFSILLIIQSPILP